MRSATSSTSRWQPDGYLVVLAAAAGLFGADDEE
jgi:hypothetical protein